MERNYALGQLLYAGFVYEKCRCGVTWRHAYIKSLKNHLELLKSVAMVIDSEYSCEEDNLFWNNITDEIRRDGKLSKHYSVIVSNNRKEDKSLFISRCNKDNQHKDVIALIKRLLDDLLCELNKFVKDKDKIWRMLHALHNLPRVFLCEEEAEMENVQVMGISPKEAFEYARSIMTEKMQTLYQTYWND